MHVHAKSLGFLVSWSAGCLVPRFLGVLCYWFFGFSGFLASSFLAGWPNGFSVPWFLGLWVPWFPCSLHSGFPGSWFLIPGSDFWRAVAIAGPPLPFAWFLVLISGKPLRSPSRRSVCLVTPSVCFRAPLFDAQ